jgi:hypothetical protein
VVPDVTSRRSFSSYIQKVKGGFEHGGEDKGSDVLGISDGCERHSLYDNEN